MKKIKFACLGYGNRGRGYTNYCLDHSDEYDVVAQSVSEEQREIVAGQEETEVLEANPLALHQIVDKAMPLKQLVLLKADQDTEHGQIGKQHVPDKGRQTQKGQLRVLQMPAAFLFLLSRVCLGESVCVHDDAPCIN